MCSVSYEEARQKPRDPQEFPAATDLVQIAKKMVHSNTKPRWRYLRGSELTNS